MNKLFVKFDMALPPLTRATLDISAFLKDHAILEATLLGAFVLAAVRVVRSTRGRLLIDRYIPRVPIVGPLAFGVMPVGHAVQIPTVPTFPAPQATHAVFALFGRRAQGLFNPALTAALVLFKRLTPPQALLCLLSQLLGAALAGDFLTLFVFWELMGAASVLLIATKFRALDCA